VKARTFPARFYQLAGLILVPSALALLLLAAADQGWLYAEKRIELLALAALVAAIVAGISLIFAVRRLHVRLDEIVGAVRRFSTGDLEHRLMVPRNDFLYELSLALNHMGARLGMRLRKAQQQRIDEAAILSTMAEGVIVVDGEERIVRMNDAACTVLAPKLPDVTGRLVQEVVRNAEIQRIVRQVLSGQESIESEVVLFGEPDRHLRVYGRPLKTDSGKGRRVLIVWNDISRLKHLETVRRDFVSNVSHELRTPITSIKGFVETLLDGAIENPTEARRFLEIVGRQAERLESIFEDLLSLSRIEQGEESASIDLEHGDITEIALRAVENCALKAEAKGVAVTLEGQRVLSPRVSSSLLEQAISNLIDNAITHTDRGGRVTVGVSEGEAEYVVSVRDTGCGIEAVHLGRLFERFYRVDKARTRKAGGTGLGLAIVKHIAQIHRGQVEVESKVGEGSLFTLRLPKLEKTTLVTNL
jgi:two-component system phosphate regulon sensor histidine kinase PhoR